MRKLVLSLLGATAALGMSSAANAQLAITIPTTVNNPGTPGGSGFNFSFTYGDNTATPSPFEELITFTTGADGFLSFGVQSTRVDINPDSAIATDVDFSSIFLTAACPPATPTTSAPGACSGLSVIDDLDSTGTDQSEDYALMNLFLNAGTYTLHIAGTRGEAGAFDGSVVMTVASNVPEPATWAMMLLGFGAIGWQMRRRRAPILAQAA